MDELDEHPLVERAFLVQLRFEADEVGFDGAALRLGVVQAAMESDQPPLEVVGDQQEVVAPLLGEPREVAGLQSAHHDAGPAVDLVVELDQGGADLSEPFRIGEALQGNLGIAREDAADLGPGLGAQGVHPVVRAGPGGIERGDHQGIKRGALPLPGPMGSEVGVEFRPEVLGHPNADAPLSGAGFEGQFGEPDAVRNGDAFVPAEGMFAGAEALARHEGPELERPPAGLQDAHEQPHAGRDFEVVFRGARLAQDGLHLKATHAVAGGGHEQAEAALDLAVAGHGVEIAGVEVGGAAGQRRPQVPRHGGHVVEPPPRRAAEIRRGSSLQGGEDLGLDGRHRFYGHEAMTGEGLRGSKKESL